MRTSSGTRARLRARARTCEARAPGREARQARRTRAPAHALALAGRSEAQRELGLGRGAAVLQRGLDARDHFAAATFGAVVAVRHILGERPRDGGERRARIRGAQQLHLPPLQQPRANALEASA